jgi:general secretion pathway protein G
MMSIQRVTKLRWMGPRTRNGSRGFTLIELLIVLTIIGILASIAQPNFQRTIIRAREASLRQSLFVMRDVIDQFYADHGRYPDSIDEMVDNRYIRAIPEDPFTKSSSTWVVIPPEGDAKGAVYDVHSGSDLVGLDGKPYNEW